MQLGGLNREPNVVPMIDILLVLLITAILGLLPKWKTDIVLPVPAPAPTTDVPVKVTQLVLSIAPGPVYSLNGQAIPRERLIPELAKVYEGRPDKTLFIDADRSLKYQEVFWIYGAVRSAGVTVTAIVPPGTRR